MEEENGYLKPEHSLPPELLGAVESNEAGRGLGPERHRLRRAVARLAKLIRRARANHERATGEKIVVEPPTAYLPDADI